MRVRRGLPGGQYKPLTEKDIRKIHQTTLRVFQEVGILVNSAAARELFKSAGAEVDESRGVVRVAPDLVESLVAQAPHVVRLCGRREDGSLDLELGGTNVYLGTGGTALRVQDPGRQDSRPARLEDIVNMARLVETLDHVHFYMLNVYPNEISEEEVDVNRFGAALNHTRKHIMGGVYTVDGVRNVARMASLIAGSPEKLKERPFVSMVTCSLSPFGLDETYAELTMEVARHGLPVVVPAEPLCGATSPVTLAGNLVVLNVDTLAGVMLAQLTNPGTPTLYGCVASITDLRDMKYLSGAVEMGLLNAAAAQLAQFYQLPNYVTAGMSDAKINDAQAGYESALTSLLVALAGGNFIHDAAGFLEFCSTASYDKLVIDNEISGMVMRAVQGIKVTDKTLAFDLLKEVGPGGHFVSVPHTRRHMRKEIYQPGLSDRDNRADWQAGGAKETWQRAAEQARRVLESKRKGVLEEELRERLVREVPGLRSSVMA